MSVLALGPSQADLKGRYSYHMDAFPAWKSLCALLVYCTNFNGGDQATKRDLSSGGVWNPGVVFRRVA